MGIRKFDFFKFSLIAIGLLSIGLLTCFTHAESRETEALKPFATNQRMQLETRSVLNIIRDRHLLSVDFRDLDYNQFIENYLTRLDFLKMYFIEEDKDEFLMRFEKSMLSYLDRGNLYPAFQIFEQYRERVLERLEWIRERLEGDFDLTSDELFEIDREKISWPASQAQADLLWEKRLQLEIIRESLGKKDEDPAEIKKRVLQQFERMKRNLLTLEAEDIQEIFLTTLMQLFDPHSSFMSSNTVEDLNIAMQNSLEGIGTLLRDEDGVCTIHELIPPGPAYRSGALSPRDRIIAVGQADEELEDIQGLPLRKIVNKIRGPAGTVVSLMIQPAESDDPQDKRLVKLVREKVQLTTRLATATIFDVPAEEKETVTRIGVVELPGFYGSQKTDVSSTDDVEELVLNLVEEGIDGLILDLRNNGGGLLNEAITMTGLFIPQGPVVAVRESNRQRVSVSRDQDSKVIYDGPMIVLVSRHSASAAEILAGALQAYNRALIVGDSATHGKGTVQAIYPLSNFLAAAVKLTSSQFFLPNGDSTQLKGVSSDLTIPSVNEILDVGESSFTNPIAWDHIQPDIWNYSDYLWKGNYQVNPELVEHLTEKSRTRIQTLPEFVYLQEYLGEVEKQRLDTLISLNLETRKQQKEEWDTKRETWKERQKELLANFTYPSQTYDLSVVEELERTTTAWEAQSGNGKEKESSSFKSISEVPSAVASGEGDGDGEEEDGEDEQNSLDTSLRETLRIMADWVKYATSPTAMLTKTSQEQAELHVTD